MTSLNNRNEIHKTFSHGVIYIYSIPFKSHSGRLKIGCTTTDINSPTQEEIETAAKSNRIKEQTQTADIPYKLEYAELAVTANGDYFSDQDVHNVLIRSGFPRKAKYTKNLRSEWFEVSLEVAKKAIQAAKEGRKALRTLEKTDAEIFHFPFRPNQLEAIIKTNKAIKQNRKHFLWNAKMRFGKTAAAMQVAKENMMKNVLIVTHRPSVKVDWYDDFNKVFKGTDYEYASKTKGENINTLINGNKPFVYFASLQDLRGSESVVSDETSGSKFSGIKKNINIFNTTWDMLIVDEAHEGTQSSLGDTTLNKIDTSFILQLSGTPFNILHKHEERDIYTWDYVMEQEEKFYWDERHSGVPNPYAELPALSMFTYDIDKFARHIGSMGENFHDALDGAFKFHEFFRVYKDDLGNDTADFVHESMVKKFLDLLVDNTPHTKFPYSTEEYRNYNKHSLWLLPNRVKVIKAMEKLLKDHGVFGSNQFGIVNISGNNQDDEEDKDAKKRVTSAINNHEYTITLTGQRLTTGASIPEWTAVFMLSDTSSAISYLQTAFRCQTPAKIDGKLKTQGYIFDFAPDRTLRLVAEAIELNHRTGKINTPEQKDAMEQFLNFCPILAAEGGTMKPYDVGTMLGQLKKAIIERVSRNGFDDPKLYNDELLQLDELDIEKFNELKTIVGSATGVSVNEIPINELGMDELETAKAEEAERKRKQKKELTEEEKEALRKLKEAREQRNSAISILRAVSIRMPMMVYGANVSIRKDITLQDFIVLVDDDSWQEFMPKGLSKDTFREFTKYYDEEVFRGVARSIRAKAFDCDDLLPTERIRAIVEIFGTFKNPDKETILTPWNVVNMHMSTALGGHDFRIINSTSEKPEWITQNKATSIWSQDDTKILEINSKSGLYPLLAAYNIYSRQLRKNKKAEDKIYKQLWKKVLSNNIYVLCKSPMARRITLRTLAGYSGAKTNIVYIKDLVQKLQQKDNYKGYNIKNELQENFGIEEKDMKFTAVVGNPPYQDKGGAGGTSDASIYQHFCEISTKISSQYVSLIIPARWFSGGRENLVGGFRRNMLNNDHIQKLTAYTNSKKIFPNVEIKGGVCYYLENKKYNGECEFTLYKDGTIQTSKIKLNKFDIFIREPKLMLIVDKVISKNKSGTVDKIISSNTPFGIPTNPKTSKKTPFKVYEKKSDKSGVSLHHIEENKRKIEYVDRADIKKNQSDIDKPKVFIPDGYGAGESFPHQILGVPELAKKNSVCSQSYLYSSFDTEEEARHFMVYIKTKFLRALVSAVKITQSGPSHVYRFVPLQNFSSKSDINWSKSISAIDKQLYAKYKLSKDGISFIESHVKPMR